MLIQLHLSPTDQRNITIPKFGVAEYPLRNVTPNFNFESMGNDL